MMHLYDNVTRRTRLSYAGIAFFSPQAWACAITIIRLSWGLELLVGSVSGLAVLLDAASWVRSLGDFFRFSHGLKRS